MPPIVTASGSYRQASVTGSTAQFGSAGVHQGKSLVGTLRGGPLGGRADVRTGRGSRFDPGQVEGRQHGGDEAADGRRSAGGHQGGPRHRHAGSVGGWWSARRGDDSRRGERTRGRAQVRCRLTLVSAVG